MIVEDVIDLIVGDGDGTKDVDVFAYSMPDTPDECLCVADYGGGPGDDFFGERAPAVEHPRVQVRVRGLSGDTLNPRVRIEGIYQRLTERGAFTVNGTRYLYLNAIQPPFPLSRDASSRMTFALNLEAWKEPTLVSTPKGAGDDLRVAGTEGEGVA